MKRQPLRAFAPDAGERGEAVDEIFHSRRKERCHNTILHSLKNQAFRIEETAAARSALPKTALPATSTSHPAAFTSGAVFASMPHPNILLSAPFPNDEIEGNDHRIVSMEELASTPTPKIVVRAADMDREEFDRILASLDVSRTHEVFVGWTSWADIEPLGVTKATGLESLRVRKIEALADGIMDAGLVSVREQARPAAQQSEDELLRQREKINRSLDVLEGYLVDGTLKTDTVNLATIAIACAVGYLNFRRVAPGWCVDRPHLVKLVENLFSRESFARTEPPKA